MDKIILKAIDTQSGWAYIEERGVLFLIKPPFEIRDKIIAIDQNLSDAIQKQGFEAREDIYKNIDYLIEYLEEIMGLDKEFDEEQAKETRKQYLLSMPETIAKEFLLDFKLELKRDNLDWSYFNYLAFILKENEAIANSEALSCELEEIQNIIKSQLKPNVNEMENLFPNIEIDTETKLQFDFGERAAQA